MEVDALERLALEQVMTAGDIADALPPRPPWMRDALCIERPSVEFVPDEYRTNAGREAVAAAVAVCQACLVRVECGAYALKRPELVGIWGGLTDTERRNVRAGVAAATSTPVQRAPKRHMRRVLVGEDPWWDKSA